MRKYDIHCIGCGMKVGEVSFDDDRPYPGDDYYGFLCEACAQQQEQQQQQQQGE